jgi:hypothetical protein
LAVLVLLAGGCMFPQGWHWPRTGADTAQTHVYWQNDTAGQYGVVAWVGWYYNGHPELAIHLVDTCLASVNCVVWRTGNNGGGSTNISIGGNAHLVRATVTLDNQVSNDAGGRQIVFHETCHALGGGFGADIHSMCNWYWRALVFSGIARVYHNDPG